MLQVINVIVNLEVGIMREAFIIQPISTLQGRINIYSQATIIRENHPFSLFTSTLLSKYINVNDLSHGTALSETSIL